MPEIERLVRFCTVLKKRWMLYFEHCSSQIQLLYFLIEPWLRIVAISKELSGHIIYNKVFPYHNVVTFYHHLFPFSKVLVQLVQESIMDRIVNGHKVKVS